MLTGVWVDLSDRWDEMVAIGEERHRQKMDYASSRPWNKNPDVVGLLGELTWSLWCGAPMNLEQYVGGDGHADFPDGTDIKATVHWQNPRLVLNLDDASLQHATRYVLVALDMDGRRGNIVGEATPAEVLAGPKHDFGYGLRYALPGDQLRPASPFDVAPPWMAEVFAALRRSETGKRRGR